MDRGTDQEDNEVPVKLSGPSSFLGLHAARLPPWMVYVHPRRRAPTSWDTSAGLVPNALMPPCACLLQGHVGPLNAGCPTGSFAPDAPRTTRGPLRREQRAEGEPATS